MHMRTREHGARICREREREARCTRACACARAWGTCMCTLMHTAGMCWSVNAISVLPGGIFDRLTSLQ